MKKTLCSFSLLLLAFALPGHGGETDAVVRIGGCSGVCVDPAGIVLTARHCHLDETVTVHFPGRAPVEATRVYIGPDVEDVIAYDCAGDDWPHADIAEAIPDAGAAVWSAGFPDETGLRPLRTARGKLLGGGTHTLMRGLEPVGEFLANTTDFRTAPGWSGGPLFDAQGAVIGILSAGNETETSFISHRATKRACESSRFDLRQLPDGGTVRKPHVLLFGFAGCEHCVRAWGDIAAGRMGAILKVKGDEVETERYVVEYVHVDTPEGLARYKALVAALEKATGRPQPKGLFPAWHVAGRAAITTGYPKREGFRRLGKWVVETLRLPVTIFEGVTTPVEPGTSLFPIDGDPLVDSGFPPNPDLGESSPLPTVSPETSPGLVEAITNRLAARVETLIRERIDARLGDDTLVGSVADVAVDRVTARIDERLGGKPSGETPVPWGGGLLGSALAAVELWFRRKGVTA